MCHGIMMGLRYMSLRSPRVIPCQCAEASALDNAAPQGDLAPTYTSRLEAPLNDVMGNALEHGAPGSKEEGTGDTMVRLTGRGQDATPIRE